MDGIRATPMQYPILGLLADRLKRAQQFAVAPGGYANPPAEILLNLLGVPAIQQTMERVAYGEPLTTGRGMTAKVRPEVAEAAMTLLPAAAGTARVAERGAMAAGRAGERIAERMVPQIMERGGMPAGLLEGMSSRTVSPLTVYHGSPAKFERFDPTKIGSGEGAQAYGYGHYLAESPKTAQGYASNITFKNNPLSYSGNLTPESDAALQQLGYFYKNADDVDLSNIESVKQFIKNASDTALEDGNEKLSKAISNLDASKISINKGSFYEIDLPDEQIARMLDFDKPLSRQTPEIQAKLKSVVDGQMGSGTWDEWLKSDPDLKNLQVDLFDDKSPEEVSALLRDAGIPGIRYLDQASRGTPNITNQRLADLYAKHQGNAEAAVDEMMRSVYNTPKKKQEMREAFLKQLETQKTSNFVVFPGGEDLLTILRRNGGLLGPYPQEQALRLAQKNAAKPISEGGLGLPPDNTPMDRARAMGYTTEGYRGSTVAETTHQNPLWWSEDPQYASAYAAHIIRPPKGQPDPYAGNVMPVLVNIGKSKEFEKFNVGGVPTDPFSGFKEGVETGFRRYAKNEVTGDMGGKIWEALTLPQNVRSRFAAFDPARRNEADILAGVLPLSLLADEEQRKKADAYFRSLLGQ